MTDDGLALIELIEKRADGDLMRELLAFAAERMMELEVEARTGAISATGRTPAASSPNRGRTIPERSRP